MRRSVFIWSCLCAAVVVGLFVVKHRVQALEENLTALNTEIISDQDAIQVLQAEWSYLNQPARLEELSRRLLGMQPPAPGQTVLMQDFLRTLQDSEQDAAGTQVAKKTVPQTRPAIPPSARPSTRPSTRPVIRPAAAQSASPKIIPPRTTPAAVRPLPSDNDDWLTPILVKLRKEQ